MPRHKRETLSVTLFPFLAVLICTMGALILVLLSMTGKIRLQAEARAKAEREKVPAVIVAEPRPAPLPEIIVRQVDDPEIEAERARRLQVWQQKLAEAQLSQEDARKLLAQRLAELEAAERNAAAAEAQLAQLDGQASSLETERQKAAEAAKALTSRQASFEEQILQTKKNLDELRKRQASAPSQYALIPYDGTSGTRRRPIYIECTGDGFRFVPEGQVLRLAELEGFTERFNPLVAGAQALTEYWLRQHREDPEKNPEPYVMLLVRPSGALNYYVARLLLSQSKTAFGYELIEESFALSEPPANPTAKALLETTVAQVLDAQPALLAAMGRKPSFIESLRRTPLEETAERGGASPRRGAFRDLESGEDKPGAGARQGSRGNAEGGPDSPGGRTSSGPAAPGGVARAPGSTGTGTGKGRRPASIGFEGPEDGVNEGSEGSSVDDGNELEPGSRTGTGKVIPAVPAAGVPSGGTEKGDACAQPGGSGDAPPRKLPWLEDSPAPPAGDRRATRGDASGRPTGTGSESMPKSQTPWRHSNRPADEAAGVPGPESPGASRGQERPQPGLRSSASGNVPGSRKVGGDDSAARRPGGRWNGTGGSTIGLEQDVRIDVFVDRMVIGENRPALGIAVGETRQQIIDKVSNRIEQVVADWGEPPRKFHWMPRLKFVVHPGGNQHYERLKNPIRDWGLSSTVEYSLDGPVKGRDDVKPTEKPKPARKLN